jgi:hypothetical protein
MTWFAFKGLNGNKAVNLSGLEEKMAAADGFHGYATEAEAEAQPNSLNPLTSIEAKAFIPGTFANNPAGAVAGAAGNAAASAAKAATSGLGLGNLDAFFSTLTNKLIWIRISEVALGLVLIAVGVAKLADTNSLARAITNNVPPIKAARSIVK